MPRWLQRPEVRRLAATRPAPAGSGERARWPSPSCTARARWGQRCSVYELARAGHGPVKRAYVGRLDAAREEEHRVRDFADRRAQGVCPAWAQRTHRRQRSGNSRSSPSLGSETASVRLVSVTCTAREPTRRQRQADRPELGRLSNERAHLVHDPLDLALLIVGRAALGLAGGLAHGRLGDELGRFAVSEAV